jgi:hypothetical protein
MLIQNRIFISSTKRYSFYGMHEDIKIGASTAAAVFCRLHNYKYTKFRSIKNCVIRASIRNKIIIDP